LAIAAFYQAEWPLLIVCPSSVKHTWQAHIETFLPPSANATVVVVQKEGDPLPDPLPQSAIVIMSYS
jgi:SWI/SNF-related matrix-associated actin-dependent regulator 1 of chromatin subfamily A